MSAEEYFGNWLRVIDRNELNKAVSTIKKLYSTTPCEPEYHNIFKVFNKTDYNKLCQVWVLQDPYPQKGISTGIALANKESTKKLSPSLNIVKESIINLEVPHNYITFDPTLESWCEQGVFLLNAALTVETGKPGSHSAIWDSFTAKLLQNLSIWQPGMIYVLYGNRAKSFKPYITTASHILELNHPAWYVRNEIKIPYKFYVELNNLTLKEFGRKIEYFKEMTL